MDFETGRKLWRGGVLERHFLNTGASTVHGETIFAASNYWEPVRAEGSLHKYDLNTGQNLWHAKLYRPTGYAPAVGKLHRDGPLSVVVPVGHPPPKPVGVRHGILDAPTGSWQYLKAYLAHMMSLTFPEMFAQERSWSLAAYNAETHTVQWWFDLEPWRHVAGAGDNERFWDRFERLGSNETERTYCSPIGYSPPVISDDGTVFFGSSNGNLYAVKDTNKDGRIDHATEVSKYWFGDAFSAEPVLAPGMLVVAPCGGGVYVFRSHHIQQDAIC